MDSIVKKLSEIESAASAIVNHAEVQKKTLDKEYQEKRRIFDDELERKTMARIQKIRDGLETDTKALLDGQSDDTSDAIAAIQRDYEARHTWYAEEILKRVTTV